MIGVATGVDDLSLFLTKNSVDSLQPIAKINKTVRLMLFIKNCPLFWFVQVEQVQFLGQYEEAFDRLKAGVGGGNNTFYEFRRLFLGSRPRLRVRGVSNS